MSLNDLSLDQLKWVNRRSDRLSRAADHLAAASRAVLSEMERIHRGDQPGAAGFTAAALLAIEEAEKAVRLDEGDPWPPA